MMRWVGEVVVAGMTVVYHLLVHLFMKSHNFPLGAGLGTIEMPGGFL